MVSLSFRARGRATAHFVLKGVALKVEGRGCSPLSPPLYLPLISYFLNMLTTQSIFLSSTSCVSRPCLAVSTEPSLSNNDHTFHEASIFDFNFHLCAQKGCTLSVVCKSSVSGQPYSTNRVVPSYNTLYSNSC